MTLVQQHSIQVERVIVSSTIVVRNSELNSSGNFCLFSSTQFDSSFFKVNKIVLFANEQCKAKMCSAAKTKRVWQVATTEWDSRQPLNFIGGQGYHFLISQGQSLILSILLRQRNISSNCNDRFHVVIFPRPFSAVFNVESV